MKYSARSRSSPPNSRKGARVRHGIVGRAGAPGAVVVCSGAACAMNTSWEHRVPVVVSVSKPGLTSRASPRVTVARPCRALTGFQLRAGIQPGPDAPVKLQHLHNRAGVVLPRGGTR